jgi:SAM-dependent methyltransferase
MSFRSGSTPRTSSAPRTERGALSGSEAQNRPERSGPKHDAELEAGSRAHYDDPAYYTSTYGRRIDDVQFYVTVAQKSGGPVLEYGIGNGRIALPIARHGVDLVGVDHSAPMLADLRARLREEPPDVRRRVTIRPGDMRALKLKRRFPLVICPFNVVLHLYTRVDVERFLARVREHLLPRGELVVDLSVPVLGDLTRDPNRPYRAPHFRYPPNGELVRYVEHFDYDHARQILFVSMEFEPMRRGGHAWTTPLAHRQFFPQEWEALLHYNGFEVRKVSGDFYGGPLEPKSDVMVWHARPRRGGRRA